MAHPCVLGHQLAASGADADVIETGVLGTHRLEMGDGYGIHGTDQPGLIPGHPSHGCIRLRNAAITRLYRLVPKGTPIEII